MEYRHPKNSIETCSDDDVSVDSPSTPTSVIERLPKTANRKAKFRGFYQSQKTLVVDSTENSVDKPEIGPRSILDDLDSSSFDHLEEESVSDWQDHTAMEQNIPEIVEDLISRSEADDLSQDDTTGYSDLNVNCTDKFRILMDLDSPGIQASLKPSNSLVNITQSLGFSGKNSLDVDCNTSDEDISEIGSDHPSPAPVRRKLRISLRNLSDSDDNDVSRSTEDSVLAPPKNFNHDEDMPTDESDVEVTDMDYYKIRHQNDKVPKTEYSLSWALTKFAPVYEKPKGKNDKFARNIRSFQSMKIPSYPSIDIPSGYDYNKNEDDTDDEDVPCKEEDFMTIDEFMGAHNTNFDLVKGKGRTKVKITTNRPKQYDYSDDEDTESLHESMLDSSGSTREEVDNYSEDTDVSEIETSYTEKLPTYKDVGLITLMEHDDLEGTVAVFSPRTKSKVAENINKKGFKPEVTEFEDEMDDQDAIVETLKTDKRERRRKDETDEEAMSGSEVSSVMSAIPVPAKAIPKARRKVLKISESLDGATVMTESDLKDKQKKKKEKEVPTEDEYIEDFHLKGNK